MKALLIAMTLTLSACGSTTQSADEAHETMVNSLDKINFSKSFCDGTDIRFYYEGRYAYSITCSDGRHFTVKK